MTTTRAPSGRLPRTHNQFDLIVVGAGPGGAATALGALQARPDARVLLLDRAPVGRDKTCGDALGPDGLAELAALGVADVLHPGERVHQFRVASPTGQFVTGELPVPAAVVPRVELDARLLRAAIAAGASFEQAKVSDVRQSGDGCVVNDRFAAPVVVGADGVHSKVRRTLKLPQSRSRGQAVAIRGYVPTPPGFNELLISWDRQPNGSLSYAWAFPTAHDACNVGYGMASSALVGGRAQLVSRLTHKLPAFDIAGAELTGAGLPLGSARPVPATGRVLLVGDAASLVNPLSGEGIFYALASGALAGAAAVSSQNPGRDYRRGLQLRFGGHNAQVKRLFPAPDHPSVVETSLRALQNDPSVFHSLLGLSGGPDNLRVHDLVRLANAGRARGTLA